jgi:hypothetical protein
MAGLLAGSEMLAAVTLALAITSSLAYRWLKPKPLSSFPHNPVNGILGDIPELTRLIKEEKSVLDYWALMVERHGPVVQICTQSSLVISSCHWCLVPSGMLRKTGCIDRRRPNRSGAHICPREKRRSAVRHECNVSQRVKGISQLPAHSAFSFSPLVPTGQISLPTS